MRATRNLYLALGLETVRFSETLVSTYEFTRRHNQEEQNRSIVDGYRRFGGSYRLHFHNSQSP
jgi:hypothetical protein